MWSAVVAVEDTGGMETRATFRLLGDGGLTAAAVTRRLGLTPTRALEPGGRVGRHSNATRDSSVWLLSSSPRIEPGTDLAEQLHRLLAILEPVTSALWDLVQAGYQATWLCYIASHATEHAAELDRQTIQRLLALPGDVWLDVCGDGLDEDQEDAQPN
jgi:hypothetical protein